MKNLCYILLGVLLMLACEDEERNQYTIPEVKAAADFTDVDGKVYKCVEIGDQIWMAENLARRLPLGCRDGVFTWNEELLDSVDYSKISVNFFSTGYLEAFKTELDIANSAGKFTEDEWVKVQEIMGKDNLTYPTYLVSIWAISANCKEVATACNVAAMSRYRKEVGDAEAAIEGQEHFEEAEIKNGHYSETYGLLYTYDAALRAIPDGWRLPTDEDWKKLERALGMAEQEIEKVNEWRGERQAALLKESGEGIGFNVRYGGARGLVNIDMSNYINLGQNGYFWCSDVVKADSVNIGMVRNIAIYSDQIMRMQTMFGSNKAKKYPVLYSIRCVKDKN